MWLGRPRDLVHNDMSDLLRQALDRKFNWTLCTPVVYHIQQLTINNYEFCSNEDQLDDGLPTADSFHNAEDSDDEVTDFVRENLRRYSLDSNFDKSGIPSRLYL